MNTYIFDFDGTLVDSMPVWSQKMLNILNSQNIDYPEDIIKTIATLGDKGTARYFKEVFGIKLSEEEMFIQMDEYAMPKYCNEIPLKDGVFDYINMLKRNNCSINVLTASPHKMLDPCLKRLGIYSLFDNIWSTDDFGLTKIDPNIYLKSVEKLGVSIKDAAFFDDNIGALKTAAKTGLFTIGVYDPTAEDFTDEIKSICNIYIKSFNDLNSCL